MWQYTKRYYLTPNCYDPYQRISLEAILDLCQDGADHHASLLGLSFDDLFAAGYIWLLVKTKVEVVGSLENIDEVDLVTWPVEAGRADFDRYFTLSDQKGRVFAYVMTKWCIVDYASRRIARSKLFADKFINARYRDRLAIEFSKIDQGITSDNYYHYRVAYSDLDRNLHFNNTRYVRPLLNALRLQARDQLKSFEIHYVKETKEDEVFSIQYQKNNLSYTLVGTVDGVIHTSAVLSLRG